MQKFALEKIDISVTAFLFVLFFVHDLLESRFEGLIQFKVLTQKLGALTDIFPNFVDLQCFYLDCRFSLSS